MLRRCGCGCCWAGWRNSAFGVLVTSVTVVITVVVVVRVVAEGDEETEGRRSRQERTRGSQFDVVMWWSSAASGCAELVYMKAPWVLCAFASTQVSTRCAISRAQLSDAMPPSYPLLAIARPTAGRRVR